MKRQLIKDGKVINSIELPDNWTGAEGEWQPDAGVTVADIVANIGDSYDGVNVIKKTLPPLTPEQIILKEKSEEEEMIEEKKRQIAIAELKKEGVVFKYN